MAYDLRITVYNNRDYEQSFTLQNEDASAMDLTGCKLLFGIANASRTIQSHDSSVPLTNKCVFIDSATTGEITLKLPYIVLKNLTPATYSHDLIVVDSEGKRSGVWTGQMIVKRGVA